MLIDEFLPEYDFSEVHEIAVNADPETVYRVRDEVDFTGSWIIRWLFRLRGLSTEKVTLKSLQSSRFERLGEVENKEIVLGLAGRFWTPSGGLKKIDAESFKTFDEPGHAKAVWNFSIEPEGKQTRLTTETRIKCLDDESWASFGRYWMLVGPFSGLIRKEMLKLIKAKAEEAAKGPAFTA